MHQEALKRAIELCGGAQKALAARMGMSQQAVSHALRAKQVSLEFALAVERATGRKVTREELRPDAFGDAA